jgi:exopolysaccharide production protein ExoY
MQHAPITSDFMPLRFNDNPAVGGSLKRGFDVVGAFAALILLSLVFIFLAIAIRMTSKGPVLFRHIRVGRNGKKFKCLKFRTMAINADEILGNFMKENPGASEEWCATRKLRQDPRVTAFGHFLRVTSLDELPQLWNVLKGDMSFVGPRPIVEDEIPHYGAAIGHYYRTRPGLTGPWQISGRNDVSYEARVAFDWQYAQSWSFRNDLIIIVKTIPVVLLSRGAY